MKYKYSLLILVLILATLLCGCGASPSDDALSAYEEILKAAPAIEGEHEELNDASFGYEQNLEKFGEHYDCFALADINTDGTLELIASSTINLRWAPISVFTYAGGKAVLLKDPQDAAAHGTFEQNASANGAYITYICEDNHIHSVWQGLDPAGETVEENFAYLLDGTTLTAVKCAVGESGNTIYFSDIAAANTAKNVDSIK